jgi:carboxypeptidase C (cathepsin A)
MGTAEQAMPDTAMDLADAIRKNPKLRVFSANEYFDLATPFFATEYDLSYVMLPPSLVGHGEFGYYPSGHMVYLNVDALKLMKVDIDRFYGEAATR